MKRLLLLLCALLTWVSGAWAYTAVSSITSGSYYRFHSDSYSTLSMADMGGTVSGTTNNDALYNQVWKVTNSGSSYTIQNLLTGLYIQSYPGTSAQYLTASGSYGFIATTKSDSGNTLFSFYDPNATWGGLHCASSQNYMVVGWSSTADASYWKLEEVTVSQADLDAISALQDAQNNSSTYTTTLQTFFSDYACSELKSTYADYSDANLRTAMANAGLPSVLQEMAVRVKNNTWNSDKDATYNGYEKSFRIHDYDIWSNCGQWRNITKTGPFSHLFHPTGIQATAGSTIYLFVGDNVKDSDASLEVEFVAGTNQTGSTVTLTRGCNAVYVPMDCEIFISYLLNSTSKLYADYPDITVHIEGGTCTGCFDMQRGHTDDDWDWLRTNMFTGTYLHVKGNSVMLNVITSNVTGESSPVNVMRVWDFVFQTLQSLAGCDQWKDAGTYKMMANCYDNDNDSSNPFWGSYGSSHPTITSSDVFSSSNLRNVGTEGGAIWVIEHELGHGHQGPINLAGQTESSNNSLAQCVNFLTATATDTNGKIFDTPRSSRGSGVAGLVDRFNNGYSWIDMGSFRTQSGDYNDVWISNRMIYQLWMYFDMMKNYKPETNDGFAFMTALYDALRADPLVKSSNNSSPAASKNDWLKLAKYAAQITQTDLSEFFQAYGFWETEATVSNSSDVPTSLIWFMGDYGNYYVQSNADDANLVKTTMQTYTTKAPNLMFLEDRCTGSTLATYNGADVSTFGTTGYYGTFSNSVTGTYTYSLDGGNVVMSDGSGAVGFKIYDENDNLVAIGNSETFAVSDAVVAGLVAGTYTVKAAEGIGGEEAVTAPSSFVTYHIICDGLEQETRISSFNEGDAPSIPDNIKKVYCEYSFYSDNAFTTELTSLTSGVTDVYVKCDFNPPFKVSTDYASANWTLWKLRNKYVRYSADADDSNDEYYPLVTSTSSADTDLWAFMGNPYTGITVLNKAAGEGKTLYAETNYPKMSDSNTTAWTISKVSDKQFMLRSTEGGTNYLHDIGGFSKFAYWNSSYAASDGGSYFTIEGNVDVIYNLVSAGRVTATSETLSVTYGSAPSLPSSMQIDNCTYGTTYYSDLACTTPITSLTSGTNMVYVTYTYTSPFAFAVADSYENIRSWYYLKIKNTNYVTYKSNSDPNVACPVSYSAGDANAMWAFVGDPYVGFTIYNKAAGSGLVLSSDSPDGDGNTGANTYATMTDGTTKTYNVWTPSSSTSISGVNGFFLATAGGHYLNLRNVANLAFWTSNHDAGSTFVVEEVDFSADYASLVVSDIQPYYDAAGSEYFKLSTTGKTALDGAGYTAALTSCTLDKYNELKTILDNNIKYPETGFYRIKNVGESGYYLGYDGSEDSGSAVCLRGMTDEASPKTVVYFTKGDGTYTLHLQGTNVGTATASTKLTVSETAANCSFVIIEPGVVSIQSGSGTYKYLHCSSSQQYAIVGWVVGSSSDASKWTVEDVASTTEISLNNGGDGYYYATLCVPFDCTVSGATAYTLTLNDDKSALNLSDPLETIAAGTPVLLRGTSNTATLTAGSEYVASPLTTTSLTGTYTDMSIDNTSTHYVLGKLNDVIGFYQWGGTGNLTIGANRAYMVADVLNVKGFAINWGDETGIANTLAPEHEDVAIYNLAGQRVSKMTRGIYIINGKKVLK